MNTDGSDMPISLYRVYGPGFATFKGRVSTDFIYVPLYSIFPSLSQYKYGKGKGFPNRAGVAQTVPGGLGSQTFMTFGT